MPIIQVSMSARAIKMTKPLYLKSGEWLIVMEDDTYRRATRQEEEALETGADTLKPEAAGGAAARTATKERHRASPAIASKTITVMVHGKTVKMAGQAFRVLTATERACHATKNSMVNTTDIAHHLTDTTDRPQVAARMLDLVRRGLVDASDYDAAGRRVYRPNNNGLAFIVAEQSGGELP